MTRSTGEGEGPGARSAPHRTAPEGGGEKCNRKPQRQKNVSFVGQLNRGNQHAKFQEDLFCVKMTPNLCMFPSSQKNSPKKAPQNPVGVNVWPGLGER